MWLKYPLLNDKSRCEENALDFMTQRQTELDSNHDSTGFPTKSGILWPSRVDTFFYDSMAASF